MSQFLPYLLFLSCPVSMGLMMWFMMRGNQGGQQHEPAPNARLAELEREVKALRSSRQEREQVEMR